MKKQLKIAILYICTGKYHIFWDRFHASAQKYLFPHSEKHFFVFSDATREQLLRDDMTYIYQPKLGWPNDTLKRFHMFSRILNDLHKYDFIFFFNSNIIFLEEINESILPTEEEGLLVVQHPGFFDKVNTDFSYERNPKSTAFIPYGRGEAYVCGGINGGTTQSYIKMILNLKQAIDIDADNGVTAVWHDESHINKYILNHKHKILSTDYAYPEGWNLPFHKKILILDKNKFGGHDFLRGDSNKYTNASIKKYFIKIIKLIKKYF